MKFRTRLTRHTSEYSYAEVTIEADSKAEATEMARKLTDWEVEFPEKNLDVEVDYYVTKVEPEENEQ